MEAVAIILGAVGIVFLWFVFDTIFFDGDNF